jgi:DHA1 family multidrug resistance protein-like MFS transporter
MWRSNIMRFSSFNIKAKRYILLHTIYSVLIISWVFLPVYLHELGLTIVEVGALFTLAGLAEVVLTYGAGKTLDKISCNYGLAIIDFFESIACFIFGLAQNYTHILIGRFVEKAGQIFTPSYAVYENEAYKEDYETMYQYHVMVPEVVQLVVFPILGFVLTYVVFSVTAHRSFYIIVGACNFLVIFYILKILPDVTPGVSLKRELQVSLPRKLYVIAAAEILLQFGDAVGSQFVLAYYILDNLGGTFFSISMVEAVVSIAIILTIIMSLKRKPEMIKAAKYGIFLMMIYGLLMSWAPNMWVIFIAYFILNIGHSLWFPRHRTLVMKLIPEEKRGEILGSIASLKKLIAVVGPLFAGLIASKIYILAPFVAQLITFIVIYFIYQWAGKGITIDVQKEQA